MEGQVLGQVPTDELVGTIGETRNGSWETQTTDRRGGGARRGGGDPSGNGCSLKLPGDTYLKVGDRQVRGTIQCRYIQQVLRCCVVH